MRQIVLDTETTGLSTADGHRIIEVGCLEIVNRKVTGNHFHRYINPERGIEADAINVHGITPEFLADKPLFHQIVEELISFIKGAELIIHNAEFDVNFLNYEFKRVSSQLLSVADYCTVLDTLALARQKHPGQKNSLDALCKRYTVDNSGRNYHGALLDARLLADVYLAMTGGQAVLFQEATDTITPEALIQHQLVKNGAASNLKILSASPEEQAAHNKFLADLKRKNNGVCLWDQE